eukprot:2157313-Pleurochrysis_carterae.AAC.2
MQPEAKRECASMKAGRKAISRQLCLEADFRYSFSLQMRATGMPCKGPKRRHVGEERSVSWRPGKISACACGSSAARRRGCCHAHARSSRRWPAAQRRRARHVGAATTVDQQIGAIVHG